MNVTDLRIIACGFFLEGYPRWDTLWEALRRLKPEQLIDLRDRAVLGSERLDNLRTEQGRNILWRTVGKIRSLYPLCRYAASIVRMARQIRADVIFVFPANFFLAICLGMLRFLHGAEVCFDLYTSAYSAARAHAPGRLKAAEAYVLEYLSSRFAHRLICLTPEYAAYYQTLYKIRAGKLHPVSDGINEIWFRQPASINHEAGRAWRVVYWGNFLVQHGLDMILDSAEELRDAGVQFVLCGKGRNETEVQEEARRRDLSNVVFKGFVPTTEELIQIVDSADIALGHLKEMHDTGLSGSNKMKQGMARGKPVITVLTRQKEELYQTRDNPLPPLIQIEPSSRALTRAIRGVMEDPERAQQMGNIARSTVERLHGIEAVTSALRKALGGS